MAKPWLKLWTYRCLGYMASCLLFIKSAFEVALRFLGPVFVVLGFSLISFAVYVHFTFVLSWYSGEPVLSLSIFSLFHLSVDIWLCIGIAWNYFKSAVTPALKFDVEISPEELAAIQSSDGTQSSRKNTRYCKYCQKGKLDRIHHCHVCNTCIPGMDHHCPWIGNCVGFHNHHYFVLFLLYLFAGCVYAASMSFFPFKIALDTSLPWPYATSRSSVVFSFILASAVASSLAFLGGWQYFLVFTGQTSIEYYIHRDRASFAASVGRNYRNLHDHGIQKNFQNFFGVDASHWWFAWLVPGMSNPVHTLTSLQHAHQQRVLDDVA